MHLVHAELKYQIHWHATHRIATQAAHNVGYKPKILQCASNIVLCTYRDHFSGNCRELGTCVQNLYGIVSLEFELECDLEASNCTGIESMH